MSSIIINEDGTITKSNQQDQQVQQFQPDSVCGQAQLDIPNQDVTQPVGE